MNSGNNAFTNFVDQYLVWLMGAAMAILIVRQFGNITKGIGTLTTGASSFINAVAS